jgi:hypothetical protein
MSARLGQLADGNLGIMEMAVWCRLALSDVLVSSASRCRVFEIATIICGFRQLLNIREGHSGSTD